MSRSWPEVGCCVKGSSVIFHSLHIGIMPKLKDRFARRHAVILHSSQAATQRYVTCHFPSRRFRGTPPVGRGEGTNYRDSAVLKGLDVLTRWMWCDFSRLTLAGGTEKLFYQGLTHSHRPWLFRDGFCLFAQTDITSLFRIDAIFTVVDSQNLYQRNLWVMRLNGTAIPGNLRWCCRRLSREIVGRNSRQRAQQITRAKLINLICIPSLLICLNCLPSSVGVCVANSNRE